MSDYNIRQAISSDLEGVYSVFKLADKLHREAHPEVFREPENPDDIRDYLLSAIRDREAVVCIAEAQGEIIGAILAWVRHSAEMCAGNVMQSLHGRNGFQAGRGQSGRPKR